MRTVAAMFMCFLFVWVIMPAHAMSFDGFALAAGASAASGLNGFIAYSNIDSSSWWWRRVQYRLDFASTRPIHSLYDSVVDSFIGDDGYTIDDITIKDLDIHAKHMSWLIDIYPLRDSQYWCGWRMTAGYMKGALNIDAELTGAVDGAPANAFGFKLGNTYYYYTGNTVHGTSEIDWEYHGPYVGTGFDFGLYGGVNIYVDLGLVFTGKKPRVGLNVPFKNLYQSSDGGNTWQNVEDENLEAIVEAERQKAMSDVQSDLDKLDFVPVIKVGVMYRF